MTDSKPLLVAVDIDGTLLDSRNELPEVNIHAIRKASASGVKIVLCTGRMFPSAKLIADKLEIPCDMVACNGALVRNGDQIVFHRAIARQSVLEAVRFGREYGIFTLAYTSGSVFSEKEFHDFHDFYKGYSGITIENAANFEELAETSEIIKILYSVPQDRIISVRDAFRQDPALRNMNAVRTMPDMLEIMPKEVNKGTGLLALAEHLKIPLSRTAAIGDNENDLEMMQMVSYPIAMGNSPENLKSVCRYVTLSNDEGGVAYALDRLLSEKGW